MARTPTLTTLRAFACALVRCVDHAAAAQKLDPLPSWNDGPVKTALKDFARRLTEDLWQCQPTDLQPAKPKAAQPQPVM